MFEQCVESVLMLSGGVVELIVEEGSGVPFSWGTYSVPSFTKNCSYVSLNAKYRPLFSYHRKKE